MAAQPKIKAGEGACFVCRREVVWRKTAGGALSCFCQHCDFQAYAKDGTEAERAIRAQLVNAPADPAPSPAPAPEPKPQPKKTGAFGLGF